jgi:hypothetical protein
MILGKVSLSILETELGAVSQDWHPVVHTARDGLSVERVGDLDLRYKIDELVVLTSGDYSEIRKVFHHCSILMIASAGFEKSADLRPC